MKKTSQTVLPFITAAVLSSTALADSYYFKGGLSAGSPNQQGVSDNPTLGFDFDNGLGFQVAAGKNFSSSFSGEIELSHQSFDFGGVYDNGALEYTASSGDLTYTTLMLNAIYNPFSSNESAYLNPFIGVGAGISRVSWNNAQIVRGSATVDDSSNVAAVQIFIGNQFKLKNNWVVDLEYKYFKTKDFDLENSLGNPATITDSKVSSVVLSIGKKF